MYARAGRGICRPPAAPGRQAKTLIFTNKAIILFVYLRFHDRPRHQTGAGQCARKPGQAFSVFEGENFLYHIGLDIGSTTIKCVVLDEQQNLLYHTYERHYSHIVEKGRRGAGPGG